jgi:hypothetical protein
MIPFNLVTPVADRARQGVLDPPGTALQEHCCLGLEQLWIADPMSHPKTAHARLKSRQVARRRCLFSPMRPSSQSLLGSSAPPPTY